MGDVELFGLLKMEEMTWYNEAWAGLASARRSGTARPTDSARRVMVSIVRLKRPDSIEEMADWPVPTSSASWT